MSSRNVIGVIGGGRLTTKKENQFDARKFIAQCQERLKTDPNYKQRDFDVDVVRCNVLKMPPNGMRTVITEPNSHWDGNGAELVPNNHDDDIFNGFDTFTTNHRGKNNGNNVGRFSHNPSPLAMMNLATPESHTSFFFADRSR